MKQQNTMTKVFTISCSFKHKNCFRTNVKGLYRTNATDMFYAAYGVVYGQRRFWRSCISIYAKRSIIVNKRNICAVVIFELYENKYCLTSLSKRTKIFAKDIGV